MIFDVWYFIYLAPAFLLGLAAQAWIKSAYAKASRVGSSMTGAEAARRIMDSVGLSQIPIEQVPGRMSDHYDPRAKVVRLSQDVYHGRTMAAVGIAAHEVGHAIQDARGYAPLVIRNVAVPAAGIGTNFGLTMAMIGVWFSFEPLLLLGIVLFSGFVFFQLVNLPVEFNASSRAKVALVDLGIVRDQEMSHVKSVLNAAAMTYVAATLQAIVTLLYYIMRYTSSRD